MPPSFGPGTGFGRIRPVVPANATSLRWAALADAGQVVAMLAGIEPERASREIRNFPALMRDSEPWRRELAERGTADLAAIMEPGIAALMAVNARGVDCKPAALALWREFTAARSALLSLLPTSGTLGPLRSA